jgi:Uma2 family endonuclease
MSALPKPKRLTVAEYLVIESRAAQKSEFYDGEMFLMAGASIRHNSLNENLSGIIHLKLKGGRCHSRSRDQMVHIERTNLWCYPDLLIVCGPLEISSQHQEAITNPRVIFEILSNSTELYDRTTKFRHYQQLPSLQEYILVSQHEPLCERFLRQADGSWSLVDFAGLNSVLNLTSVDVQLPLAELYAGIDFEDNLPLRPLD